MSSVPILETPRLRLRGHTLADLDASAAMWANAEVTRFIGGKVSTREESWGRVLRMRGLWPLLGYGYWVFEERATGKFVGEGGFADFHREMTPSFGDAPEQGWALAPWAHGQGYATEAGGAALAWADANLKRDFVCMIDPDNTRSQRVAAKFGYVEYERTTYKDDPIVLFRRPALSS